LLARPSYLTSVSDESPRGIRGVESGPGATMIVVEEPGG
jgi:hypothetical protein